MSGRDGLDDGPPTPIRGRVQDKSGEWREVVFVVHDDPAEWEAGRYGADVWYTDDSVVVDLAQKPDLRVGMDRDAWVRMRMAQMEVIMAEIEDRMVGLT